MTAEQPPAASSPYQGDHAGFFVPGPSEYYGDLSASPDDMPVVADEVTAVRGRLPDRPGAGVTPGSKPPIEIQTLGADGADASTELGTDSYPRTAIVPYIPEVDEGPTTVLYALPPSGAATPAPDTLWEPPRYAFDWAHPGKDNLASIGEDNATRALRRVTGDDGRVAAPTTYEVERTLARLATQHQLEREATAVVRRAEEELVTSLADVVDPDTPIFRDAVSVFTGDTDPHPDTQISPPDTGNATPPPAPGRTHTATSTSVDNTVTRLSDIHPAETAWEAMPVIHQARDTVPQAETPPAAGHNALTAPTRLLPVRAVGTAAVAGEGVVARPAAPEDGLVTTSDRVFGVAQLRQLLDEREAAAVTAVAIPRPEVRTTLSWGGQSLPPLEGLAFMEGERFVVDGVPLDEALLEFNRIRNDDRQLRFLVVEWFTLAADGREDERSGLLSRLQMSVATLRKGVSTVMADPESFSKVTPTDDPYTHHAPADPKSNVRIAATARITEQSDEEINDGLRRIRAGLNRL